MEWIGTKKWLLLLVLPGMSGIWIACWQSEESGSIAVQGMTTEQALNMQMEAEEAKRQRYAEREEEVYNGMMADLYELARTDPLAVMPRMDANALSLEFPISHEDYMSVIYAASERDLFGVVDQMIDHYRNAEELPDLIGRVLEEKPDWVKGLLTRGQLRAYTPWAADYDGAESDLHKVIELDADSPESASARVMLGSLWQRESLRLTKAGKHKEAEALVEKALPLVEAAVAAYPDSAGHTVLAKLYLDMGRTDDAITSAKKAIELNPDTQVAKHMLSKLQ